MRSSSRLALDNAPRLDSPGLAVMALCAAVALASSIDAIVKFLSGGYPVHQLMMVRAGAALPLLAIFVLWREGTLSVPRAQWKLVGLRGLIMASAYLGFSMAVATLPLASGVAIYFTMPLFVAALAGPVLAIVGNHYDINVQIVAHTVQETQTGRITYQHFAAGISQRIGQLLCLAPAVYGHHYCPR